jgi:hypothetical protein
MQQITGCLTTVGSRQSESRGFFIIYNTFIIKDLYSLSYFCFNDNHPAAVFILKFPRSVNILKNCLFFWGFLFYARVAQLLTLQPIVFSHISLSIFSIVYTFLVLFDSMFVIVKLMHSNNYL